MDNFNNFASLTFVGIGIIAIALLTLFYAPYATIATQGTTLLYMICAGMMCAGIGAAGMGANLD